MTFTTVLSVFHVSHEDTGTTGWSWTFSSQSFNVTFVVDFVVGQNSQLVFSVLVLDLLWSGVNLLLSLLTTTSQSQDQVQRRFLLDVVVRQSSTIFQLFTSKDQSLLIWWNTFFVLDFRFDIVNGVGGLDFQGNSFTS